MGAGKREPLSVLKKTTMSELQPHSDLSGALPVQEDSGTRSIKISLKNVIWPLLLSLLVLVAIGYFTFDPEAFKATIERVNPWFAVGAVATLFFRVWFGAWRFSFISQGKLGFWKGLRGQLAWDFFSNVTPAALGGGPFAALYVSRDANIPVGQSTSLVLFTILLDQLWSVLMVPIILVTALFIPVIPEGAGTVGTVAILGYFTAMLCWVALLGYASLFRPDLLERGSDRLFRLRFLRRFRKRVAHEMRQLSTSARILRTQPPAFFAKAFLLSAGTWIPRYVLPVLLVLSVWPSVDTILFFLRSITMMVCSFVVPTPGGAGGIEGLYALFLGPLIPRALVAPTLLMWRFFGYYIFVAFGGFIFRFSNHEDDTGADEAQDSETTVEHPVPAPAPEPEFVESEE